MTFGTKLRRHREKKKLSKKEVAEQLNIAQATYCNWEMDVSSFRVQYLTKLAQVFNVDIVDLLPESAAVKVMNNQNHKSCDTSVVGFEVNVNGSRELYAELLSSKDEIIMLLKAENIQLKTRNVYLEEKEDKKIEL